VLTETGTQGSPVPYAVEVDDDDDDGDVASDDDELELPEGTAPGWEESFRVVDEGSSVGPSVVEAPPVHASMTAKSGAERIESLLRGMTSPRSGHAEALPQREVVFARPFPSRRAEFFRRSGSRGPQSRD
jgi:hypothetical protein